MAQLAPQRSTRRGRTLALPRPTDRQAIALLAIGAVLLRMPFLLHPLGLDEGGFAYIAAQVGEGSGSLYGDQWVDRPPLLVGLFAVAIALGGELGIRLLGCVASAVTVTACAGAAGRVAGRTAAVWAGGIAAVLGTARAFQGHQVNGEVIAIAFVAVAIWLLVCALVVPRRAFVAGVGAGAAAAAAVLVKQSFIDGFVFGSVLLAAVVLLARSPGTTSRLLRRAAGRAAAGVLVGMSTVAALAVAWAELRGPGTIAVVDAMYGFRLDARDAIEAYPDAPERRRLVFLGTTFVTGLAPLLAIVVAGLVAQLGARERERRDLLVRAMAIALLVLAAWGLFAVVQGGNWWRHYLLQLVPMLAVAGGMLVALGNRRVAGWSAVALVVAAGWWLGAGAWSIDRGASRDARAVGAWVRSASEPGDTAFVAWGHANVLWYSGLETPYDTVWSLPMRVHDPEGARLRELIAGEDAPTWIVRWGGFPAWGFDEDGRISRLVRRRYDKVAEPCGRAVFRLVDERQSVARAVELPPEPDAAACGSGGMELLGMRTW